MPALQEILNLLQQVLRLAQTLEIVLGIATIVLLIFALFALSDGEALLVKFFYVTIIIGGFGQGVIQGAGNVAGIFTLIAMLPGLLGLLVRAGLRMPDNFAKRLGNVTIVGSFLLALTLGLWLGGHDALLALLLLIAYSFWTVVLLFVLWQLWRGMIWLFRPHRHN